MYLHLIYRNLICVRPLLILFAIWTSSCVDSRLAFSDYYFTDVNTAQRWVWKNNSGEKHVVIQPTIVDYKISLNSASFVRQVLHSYDCEDRTVETEVLDQFEYWIIDFKTDIILGPLRENQFKHQLPLYEGLDLPSENVVRKSKALKPKKLISCTNAKLIQ